MDSGLTHGPFDLHIIYFVMFYRNDLDGTTLQSVEESDSNAGRLLNVAPHEGFSSPLELHGYRRLEVASASEGQRSAMGGTKSNGKERTEKFSSSGSVKIDLNCHETDSAIVTSSSDIIAVENSDTDVHSNFTGSSASGDEKVGSFEPGADNNMDLNYIVSRPQSSSTRKSVDEKYKCELKRADYLCSSVANKHRKSSAENVSSVLTTTTTVDGVSSTSPEPKTEIVSTSADPGLGIGSDSVARYLNDAVATGKNQFELKNLQSLSRSWCNLLMILTVNFRHPKKNSGE